MCRLAKQTHRPTGSSRALAKKLNVLRSQAVTVLLIISHKKYFIDCDQSNYSSRIVFSHIPIEFGRTGNSAIGSADPENPT